MPNADIDGWQLAVTDSGGDGPPVLFCHGERAGSGPGAYDGSARELADVYRVLTVAVRGDVTQPIGDAWSPARTLFGLLDAIGIERAVLCGADDTAEPLVRAALLHPDRVRGLALLHPDLPALRAARDRPGADPDLDHLDDRLDELAMPVLVIHGTDDPRRPVDDARRELERVADPRGLVEVAGGDAELATTHASLVTDALRDYLEDLPA